MQLGESDIGEPNIGFCIVRTDAQRLKDMALSFLGMAVEQLCETNQRVRRSQIRIQSQRSLEFRHGLRPALVLDFGRCPCNSAPGRCLALGKHSIEVRLDRREARRLVGQ